jgi:3-oxoacyl-[acyl-carrier protein] reductase
MRIVDVVGELCLITGAGRGVGAAAARGLAAAVMRIGVHYRSGVAEAKAAAADIAAAGCETVRLSGDIADPGTMERLVQEMATHFGPASRAHQQWRRLDRALSGGRDIGRIVRSTGRH